MCKEIKFPEGCNNKLKQLGVNRVTIDYSYHCQYGSMKPFRKSPYRDGGLVTFWHDKGNSWSEMYLGGFYTSKSAVIKKFLKVLADIKQNGLPLNQQTIDI